MRERIHGVGRSARVTGVAVALSCATIAGCLAARAPSAEPSVTQDAPSASPGSSVTETGSPTAAPTAVDATVAAGLALVRPVDGVSQVFVIGSDGSARQVSGLGDHASVAVVLPIWSPDRTRMALRPQFLGSGPSPALWMVNADGSEQRRLEAVGESISWSPDSTRLLYEDSGLVTDTTGEPARLWILDAATGRARAIGRGNVPAWLPDGRRISYYPVVSGPIELADRLFVVERPPLGDDPRPVTRSAAYWWSPDGTALLLLEADGLYLADTDGSNPRRLLDSGDAAVWSPDSSRIAFADVTDDGTFTIGVVDRDGKVLWSGVPGVEATWSPDGSKLAIEVGVEELSIQILDAATGELLWEMEGQDPAWAAEPGF